MRMLSEGALRGLLYIQRYRYLTISQYAKVASFSDYHAGEVLRTLEGRGQLGFFGFFTIPGQGRTPKVYFLKKKGYELLTLRIWQHNVLYEAKYNIHILRGITQIPPAALPKK